MNLPGLLFLLLILLIAGTALFVIVVAIRAFWRGGIHGSSEVGPSASYDSAQNWTATDYSNSNDVADTTSGFGDGFSGGDAGGGGSGGDWGDAGGGDAGGGDGGDGGGGGE